jgi:hypothetical protein
MAGKRGSKRESIRLEPRTQHISEDKDVLFPIVLACRYNLLRSARQLNMMNDG